MLARPEDKEAIADRAWSTLGVFGYSQDVAGLWCFKVQAFIKVAIQLTLILDITGKLQRAQTRSPWILVPVGDIPKQAFTQDLESF